ncbi:MAG: acyltransferase family protein [Chthoniobacterales bacterium]
MLSLSKIEDTAIARRGSAADPSNRRFIPQLESLRGVCALLVATFHASQARTGPKLNLVKDPRTWTDPVWNGLFWVYHNLTAGPGAVLVFFVLSGFVLTSSIERGPRDMRPAARHFLTGRIFRLYPAIISTVLLFCIAFWLTGAVIPGTAVELYRPGNIVRNMLLLDANIDGVMWTLQVEMLAIPLIFFATFGRRRFGENFTLILSVCFIALSVFRPYKHLIAGGGSLTFLYAFLFGVAIKQVGPRFIDWIGPRRLGWAIAVLLFLFFAPRAYLGQMSRWGRFFQCASAAGIIAVLVYGKENMMWRILTWQPFRFYGRISYSFFLLHPLTLLVIWTMPGTLSRLLDAGVPSVILAIALAIVSILAITPLAWLSWRFVELPGVALGRRLSPDRRNASPYVSAHGRVVDQP